MIVKEYKIKKHMVEVSRIYMYLQAWMKEERDKTWGRGEPTYAARSLPQYI
jgi:hypothetical protein